MLSHALAALESPPPFGDLGPASLFLDFDGTLVELIDRPDEVWVDPALHDLLARLTTALPGRLAIVSGRSIDQLDGLLGPLAGALRLAGSHGAERREPGGKLIAPPRPPALDIADHALTAFAAIHPGVVFEPKSFGAALHFRLAPQYEGQARALAERLAAGQGLAVQLGKAMVELKTPSDKGLAVSAFMAEPPMAETRPIFIGDDLTDETGFAAARSLGGQGILAGPPRETAAVWRLEGVAAVRGWLSAALS